MIPNVTMTWKKRTSECKWCEKDIEVATPCVSVFFWFKGNEERRGWNVKLHFHPQCWIEQGLDYLKMNPYVPHNRSRELKGLTPKQKVRRLTILRQKASLEQRKRNLKSEYPERTLLEAKLDTRIAELMMEISKIGGIPLRWITALT